MSGTCFLSEIHLCYFSWDFSYSFNWGNIGNYENKIKQNNQNHIAGSASGKSQRSYRETAVYYMYSALFAAIYCESMEYIICNVDSF